MGVEIGEQIERDISMEAQMANGRPLTKGMRRLSEHVRGGCGAAVCRTSETHRMTVQIGILAQSLDQEMHYWTLGGGLTTWGVKKTSGDQQPQQEEEDDLKNPHALVDKIAETAKARQQQRGIWVLVDFDPFIDDPQMISKLKNLIPLCQKGKQFVVFLGAEFDIPTKLEPYLLSLRLDLPTREEIKECLWHVLSAFGQDESCVKVPETNVVSACQGMTNNEIENAIATVAVRSLDRNEDDKRTIKIDEQAVQEIAAEKTQIVEREGLLEVFDASNYSMKDVGGLDLLKGWLDLAGPSFQRYEDASKFGLPAPKGVMVVGVPGAGKSLTAKCLAEHWGLPLLKFDPGKVFGSLVGQSEERIRKVTQTAEAMAPCVIWVDEIEKGLAGLQSSGVTDSGVTARVFGTLLTWMQENNQPVFLIATANQVQNLPAALIRRFDEIFAVEIPTKTERQIIWDIHIKKARRGHGGRNPEDFDLDALVDASLYFTGAEIEKAWLMALRTAFAEGREVAQADVISSCTSLTPVYKSMREQIDALRKWARTNARPASSWAEKDKDEFEANRIGFRPGGEEETRSVVTD